MTEDAELIAELLEKWLDARERGSPLTVEELCRNTPEVLAAVQEQLSMLAAMAWLEEPDRPESVDAPRLVSVEEFQESLQEAGLLTADDLLKLKANTSPANWDNTTALAEELIRLGKLTTFQAQMMSEGRGRQLILGNYLLLDILGTGGMGQVFRARHNTLNRLVALKLLREDRLRDNGAVARFKREMTALGRVPANPHVVLATDAMCINGLHVLVMEFCEGCDLANVVKAVGPLRIADACEIARQAAKGLSHLARQSLVHRDLKPSNMLLTVDGIIKILDLGLARIIPRSMELLTELTSEGQVLGTSDYMAPEQWRDSRDVDIRTDLYSLGCTLHFLLAGRPPFQVGSDNDVLAKQRAHQLAPVPRLRYVRSDVPDGLQDLICDLMGKSVIDRPDNPADVVQRLTQWTHDADLQRLIRQMRHQIPALRSRDNSLFKDTVIGDCHTFDRMSPASERTELHDRPATETAHLQLQISGTPFVFTASTKSGTTTVGRQRRRPGGTALDGCDFVIRLPDGDLRNRRISRQHLRIQHDGEEFLLTDLSRSGTRLNGEDVPPGVNVRIQTGDRILIAGLVELNVLPTQPIPRLVDSAASVTCQLSGNGQPVLLEVSVGDLKTLEPHDEHS